DRDAVDGEGEARDARVLVRLVGGLEGARDGQRRVRQAAADPLEADRERAGERDRDRLVVAAGGVGVARAGGRRARGRLGGARAEEAAGIGGGGGPPGGAARGRRRRGGGDGGGRRGVGRAG